MSAGSSASTGALVFNRTLLRLGVWARKVRLVKRLAVSLFVIALLLGGVTVFALSRPDPNQTLVWILLNVDAAIVLVLTVIVARLLSRAWSARRADGAGSRLHGRLVLLFGAVAITPAIIVAGFTAVAFHLSFQSWFDRTVSTAIEESQQVARAYLKAHVDAIAGSAAILANDLNRQMNRMPNSQVLDQFLQTQMFLRNLNEVVVFTGTGQVVGRAGLTFSMQFETVPDYVIEESLRGEVVVIPGATNDRVRALVALQVPDTFLYIGRLVDPQVRDHIQQADSAVQSYQEFQNQRNRLQIIYIITFVVVVLLLLLAATWAGLVVADRLARPIVALIRASERVRQGDLTARVPEMAASDEVATLSRAFNRMTARLSDQQDSLKLANLELDERRRFTETVLSGVTAGVIGLDGSGCINLPNPRASQLLGRELDQTIGSPLAEVEPLFAPLLESVCRMPDRPFEQEVKTFVGDRQRVLLVRVAAELAGRETTGFVVTFDDMTDLQNAQRTAAWADVARRIAHEIKNPLTPIQLSAERLKRKYLKQIESDPETFLLCTNTIVRHVEDIGSMVDEFSSFARMPAPVLRQENIRELVEQAVFLQKTAFPEISFTTEYADQEMATLCDSRQINQAMVNLLKNAVEAIDGRKPESEDAALDPGRIAVSCVICEEVGPNPANRAPEAEIQIRIRDNGKGLPVAERDRLTEPYVTTRAKGTGLGLAIVKKILEDHRGHLILQDNPDGGACVTIALPLLQSPSSSSIPVPTGGPDASSSAGQTSSVPSIVEESSVPHVR